MDCDKPCPGIGGSGNQCPVQVVSKKARRTSLEWREIVARLLGILSEEVAKSYLWVSMLSHSVATRLSVIDRIGAESVARQT